MSVVATAHLNFRGEARAALDFYHSVFGGQIMIATYADIHAVEEPAQAEQVAFGRLDAPSGFSLMAYDVQPSKGYGPGQNPFYIRLQGSDGGEIQGLWTGLAEGGREILVPLGAGGLGPALRHAHRPLRRDLDRRRRHRRGRRLSSSAVPSRRGASVWASAAIV